MEKEIQNTSENISSIFNTNTNKSKEYDRQRYENNKQILEILKNSIEENKNLRFVQILWMLNIVDNTDRFYEEPTDTLKRCEKRILQFFAECPQRAKCLDLLQRMQEICNS